MIYLNPRTNIKEVKRLENKKLQTKTVTTHYLKIKLK